MVKFLYCKFLSEFWTSELNLTGFVNNVLNNKKTVIKLTTNN